MSCYQNFASDKLFTGHEHVDAVGLIHMNGRAYDPELGRFLSVDPFIQAPTNSQSLNPYSYVMNNPLAMTDPTGFAGECATKSGVCYEAKDDARQKYQDGNRNRAMGPTLRANFAASNGVRANGASNRAVRNAAQAQPQSPSTIGSEAEKSKQAPGSSQEGGAANQLNALDAGAGTSDSAVGSDDWKKTVDIKKWDPKYLKLGKGLSYEKLSADEKYLVHALDQQIGDFKGALAQAGETDRDARIALRDFGDIKWSYDPAFIRSSEHPTALALGGAGNVYFSNRMTDLLPGKGKMFFPDPSSPYTEVLKSGIGSIRHVIGHEYRHTMSANDTSRLNGRGEQDADRFARSIKPYY